MLDAHLYDYAESIKKADLAAKNLPTAVVFKCQQQYLFVTFGLTQPIIFQGTGCLFINSIGGYASDVLLFARNVYNQYLTLCKTPLSGAGLMGAIHHFLSTRDRADICGRTTPINAIFIPADLTSAYVLKSGEMFTKVPFAAIGKFALLVENNLKDESFVVFATARDAVKNSSTGIFRGTGLNGADAKVYRLRHIVAEIFEHEPSVDDVLYVHPEKMMDFMVEDALGPGHTHLLSLSRVQ